MQSDCFPLNSQTQILISELNKKKSAIHLRHFIKKNLGRCTKHWMERTGRNWRPECLRTVWYFVNSPMY